MAMAPIDRLSTRGTKPMDCGPHWNSGQRRMNPLQIGIRMLKMLPISIIFIRIMHGLPSVNGVGGDNWCNLDTGYSTIEDGRGYPHSVYISVTRDGSIWIRAGVDHESADWTYQSETTYKVKVTVLGHDVTSMLKSLDYMDYCVLSDLNLVVNADGGWHPSYIVLYDPEKKTESVAAFKEKESKDCHTQTNISLSGDKQAITCNGGSRHVCGMRHLPEKGHATSSMFINNLQLNPKGPDSSFCENKEEKNFYNFKGSYYHIYIKVATCPMPSDSRIFGHGATLRAHTDKMNNTVIIPDPTQSSLRGGVIQGWQVFAKVVSIEHGVFLQVWRPTINHENAFTLIGQSYFKPQELRFQQLTLQPDEYIHAKAGDVLGIYFPNYNPLAWSSVPCAYETQQYKYLKNPSNVFVRQTVYFKTAPAGDDACRHYSLAATFANKTHAKSLEDWICPTARLSTGARIRSDSGNDVRENDQTEVVVSNSENSDTNAEAPKDSDGDRNILTQGTIPLHLILIIIGCLFVLLMVVGFISYYKAMKS